MRQSPPLTQFWKYPITAGTALLAIGVTLAWWGHVSIAPLTESSIHFFNQPWRLVGSMLPHVSIWHLAFNIYWLWRFGTILEPRVGHLRFALIVLLLAAGSGAAELAFLDGGVGLSGVGYGLFGMLCIMARRDPRLRNALDLQTVFTFVVWFFICIVMTVRGIMPVANIAHAMGAILGATVGWMCVTHARERMAAGVLLVLLVAATVVAATLFRPLVNFSATGNIEYVNAGIAELQAQRNDQAIAWLEKAVQYRADPGFAWYNLGVGYLRQDQPEKALACYREAVRRNPAEAAFRDGLEKLQTYMEKTSHPTMPEPLPTSLPTSRL